MWFHAENDQLNDDHTFAFNRCAHNFFSRWFHLFFDHHITIDDSSELHAIELYSGKRRKKNTRLIGIHNEEMENYKKKYVEICECYQIVWFIKGHLTHSKSDSFFLGRCKFVGDALMKRYKLLGHQCGNQYSCVLTMKRNWKLINFLLN